MALTAAEPSHRRRTPFEGVVQGLAFAALILLFGYLAYQTHEVPVEPADTLAPAASRLP